MLSEALANQEKWWKHGLKPNVRLKGGSAKNTNLTSQRVANAANKARLQRQTMFESGRRARSLDRITPGSGGSSSGYQTRSKTKNTSPFLSENRFDALGDDDVGDGVEQQKKEPRVRIPPIFIVGKSVADVVKLLNINGVPQGDDYMLKFTKATVQFLTKSKELFTTTVALLKSSGVQFYTHDTSENVLSKFVLSGLPAVNIADLKEELEALSLEPLDVKVLSTSKSGADEHTLYLVYFKRGSVKIQDLRKTKAIFNVVVSWRHFSKHPNDVAQCHRCQKFGHGSSNCNLPPKCVKCGGKHLTDVCGLPRKAELNNTNNSKSQLKCVNCGGSHCANFRGCPTRIAYLEELEKRKKKPSRQVPQKSAPPNRNEGPPIRPKPTPPGLKTYAQVASRSETTVPCTDLGGDGLFTASEFLCLAREMFTRLVGCRTKQQQFDALAELMAKYLYNG